jgi:hypothetical protein
MPSVQGVDDNSPQKGFGVHGLSNTGYGVWGASYRSRGVYGHSDFGYGVVGQTEGSGVAGVYGYCKDGYGVRGSSSNYPGVYGRSGTGPGVFGVSYEGYGVAGRSNMSSGVFGYSSSSSGVNGKSNRGSGVSGDSINGFGVTGSSENNIAVYARSQNNDGVRGDSSTAIGVYGYSGTGYGLYARGESGLAALLDGNVTISGNLTVGGILKSGGAFRIDHPLDPANKYLSHSFVESPDMKNVYDGVVVLDDKGEAEIELPDWFGALNKEFRYQLTAIGAPAPNLYIAEEISDGVTNYSNNSRFKVAGGISGMKVSWQVTGIRKDPYANAHRIPVEEDKPAKERGYYTYPELYGQPEERGIISRLLVPKIERKSCRSS